jgi:hypothetical protein
MAQPQLVQIALESGGHNAIGLDQEGGVWRPLMGPGYP